MSFRLQLKSVTLNDVKRRDGRYFALLSDFRIFRPITSKWLKFYSYTFCDEKM